MSVGPKKQIIGTWEFDEGFTITFMDDGTFLDDDGRIITGVYSFADDKICLTSQMVSGIRSTNTAMYTYEINGDELTLMKMMIRKWLEQKNKNCQGGLCV